MRRLAAVGLAVVLAVGAAACGGDDGGAIETGGTTSSTAPSTTVRADEAQPSTGIDPMTDASTTPVSVPATGDRALLTAVRASRHEGYDRVVFEFTGDVPGYQVAYGDKPVREDGSGNEVAVAGDHVVLVRFENASGADLSKENAPETYTGPKRFDPGTPEIAELVRAGDFEGVLTWAVGLRDKVAFRVSTLTAPPRVVVDFQNH